jgi:DNA-binding beta-propeller fold protein YncE
MRWMAVAGYIALHAATLPSLSHSPDLYVSGFFASSVYRYYGPRSAHRGPNPAPSHPGAVYAQAVLRRPWGIAFGPDGHAYVANISGATPAIVRVDGPFSATPGAVRDFVIGGAFFDLAFGPDGNLYAAGRGPIRRFDLRTGEQIDEFTHGHDLAETRGIAFGPDGLLYVSNYDSCSMGPTGCTTPRGEIVRFDALSGDFVDVLLSSGQNGLVWPWKIAFSATGELLVVNWSPSANNVLAIRTRRRQPHDIRRQPLPEGGVFIARDAWSPLYLAVGPDGNVYVSDSTGAGNDGTILRFDGATGAFMDVFVEGIEGGPRGIAFAPKGH